MGIKKEIADLAVKGVKELGELAAKAGARETAKKVEKRTLAQIMDTIPAEARPEKPLTVPGKREKAPAAASKKFNVTVAQTEAEKARAAAARATKTKYAAVEPHPNPHPELADFEFPQGAGLGGPHAIENSVPIVGRKPFMAQSDRGYSGLAASTPANRVVADIVPVQMNPRVIITPEDIAKKFAAGIPLTGDKLRVGNIAQVNDRPQVGMAAAHGGPDYSRRAQTLGAPQSWASLNGVVSSLDNMREAGENLYEGPVAGVYTAMGNTGLDQTTTMMDLLGRQLAAGGVTKANLKILDQKVKAILGEGNPLTKNFIGFEKDPMAAAAQLNDISRVQMPKRTAIIQSLDSANAMAAGLPDIGANRVAATTPELLYAPEGASGHAIASLSGGTQAGGALSNAPTVPHPNYPKEMGGEYFGGLEQSVPRELMFPSYFKAMQGSGYDPVQVQAYLFSRTPKEIKEAFGSDPRIQQFDQEWVDKNSKYLEDIAKYGPEPFAHGGLAVVKDRKPKAAKYLAARNPSKEAPKELRVGKTR